MLTGQQRLPAKPFDPLEELKQLRQRLTLRMQASGSGPPATPLETEIPRIPHRETEPVSLETVVNKVENIKNSLAVWQRSRARSRVLHRNLFQNNRRTLTKKKEILTLADQYNVPQEGILETFNAALTALGIVGAIFGVMSLSRGWEGDLSVGSWVCASGAAIVVLGLGGRFLASGADSCYPATRQ